MCADKQQADPWAQKGDARLREDGQDLNLRSSVAEGRVSPRQDGVPFVCKCPKS